MFVEVLLPLGIAADRDEVEDAVAEAIEGEGEVVGAGTGELGSNLDVEFDRDVDVAALTETLAKAMHSVRVVGASFRVEGTEAWISL